MVFIVPADNTATLSVPVLHILIALADRDRHGYGIMLEVEEMTRGEVMLGPGTLYGAIKRLLSDDLITEVDEHPDEEAGDERRRYYQLTKKGRDVAAREAGRLERVVAAARFKRLLPAQRTA